MSEKTANTADLPDLPSLESAESTDHGTLALLAVHGGSALAFVAMAVWLTMRYQEFMETWAIAMVGLMALCAVWLVVRVLFGDLYFRTDGAGFTVGGPLRRRYVHWSEVHSASISKSRTGETVLQLETPTGTVKAMVRSRGGKSGDVLVASVWQHLRRAGRADGIELTEEMLSLWQPIGRASSTGAGRRRWQ